uniref:Ovule protein n=1 Tax=Brugia timori TaxID=42155 RepID=A0A158PT43_9BILA
LKIIKCKRVIFHRAIRPSRLLLIFMYLFSETFIHTRAKFPIPL